MSQLFIVPASNPRALDNLDATVRRRVPPSKLAGLSRGARDLARAAPDGVRAWGTRPGTRDINVSTWKAIAPGDWALFYVQGHFPLCARILVREHSPAVAERLWGSDAAGTWEYMYLLDEVREVDAPRLLVLQALGYEEGFFPRGFIRVDRDLDAKFGGVEALLEQLAGTGREFRRAVEAAAAGDDLEAAVALDRIAGEMSDRAIRESVASYASSAPPEVREQMVKRIKRDRKLAVDLKALYAGRCQVCDFTFPKQDGSPYSEAAHIRPISLREADLDVKDNLVVLCPNHHKMLDYEAMRIDFDPSTRTLDAVIGSEATKMKNKHVGQ
jgi:hypothetical protein